MKADGYLLLKIALVLLLAGGGIVVWVHAAWNCRDGRLLKDMWNRPVCVR